MTSRFALCATVLAACSGDDFRVGAPANDGAPGNAGNGGAADTGGAAGSPGAGRGGGSSGNGGTANGGSASGGVSGGGGTPAAGSAGSGGTSSGGAMSGGGAGQSGGSAGTAAGGSGGAATGGTAGAGTGGAPPVSACRNDPALANVIFCDDFEAPGLPAWKHFALTGDDGETKRVSAAGSPKRGIASLQSTKTLPGSRDPLIADVLPNLTTGSLYLRVWLYIPATTQITNAVNANASLLVLGESAAPLGGMSLALWNSGLTIQANGFQAASFAVTAQTFPRDAWFCLRMDFPIGTSVSKSDFHVRIADTVLPNREPDAVVNSTLGHPYDRVWMGINFISGYQLSPVVVYYDDLVVDTQDVTCGG